MTDDELDEFLQDRLNLSRAEAIAALKMLPAYRTRTGSITAEEARFLDAAGLADDPASYSQVCMDAIATHADRRPGLLSSPASFLIAEACVTLRTLTPPVQPLDCFANALLRFSTMAISRRLRSCG
jgi:hypothetical protein